MKDRMYNIYNKKHLVCINIDNAVIEIAIQNDINIFITIASNNKLFQSENFMQVGLTKNILNMTILYKLLQQFTTHSLKCGHHVHMVNSSALLPKLMHCVLSKLMIVYNPIHFTISVVFFLVQMQHVDNHLETSAGAHLVLYINSLNILIIIICHATYLHQKNKLYLFSKIITLSSTKCNDIYWTGYEMKCVIVQY